MKNEKRRKKKKKGTEDTKMVVVVSYGVVVDEYVCICVCVCVCMCVCEGRSSCFFPTTKKTTTAPLVVLNVLFSEQHRHESSTRRQNSRITYLTSKVDHSKGQRI